LHVKTIIKGKKPKRYKENRDIPVWEQPDYAENVEK